MIEACRALGLAARFRHRLHLCALARCGPCARRRLHPCLGAGLLPGAGWIEFDPTNGIVGSRDLIRVRVARTPKQAMPLKGSFIGDREDYLGMTVEVQVSAKGAASPCTVPCPSTDPCPIGLRPFSQSRPRLCDCSL